MPASFNCVGVSTCLHSTLAGPFHQSYSMLINAHQPNRCCRFELIPPSDADTRQSQAWLEAPHTSVFIDPGCIPFATMHKLTPHASWYFQLPFPLTHGEDTTLHRQLGQIKSKLVKGPNHRSRLRHTGLSEALPCLHANTYTGNPCHFRLIHWLLRHLKVSWIPDSLNWSQYPSADHLPLPRMMKSGLIRSIPR